MNQLTQGEKEAFLSAATSFFTEKEALAPLMEEKKQQLGNQPGRVPVPNEALAPVMAASQKLQEVMTNIGSAHPGLPAIRFRGYLFTLTQHKGQILGVHLIQESEIETVEA
jgi:hypothetical protein